MGGPLIINLFCIKFKNWSDVLLLIVSCSSLMSTRLRAIIIWEKLIRQNYHQLETRKTRLCTAGDYEDECFPRILQMLPRSIIQGQTNLKRFVYKRVPLLEDTLKKNLVLFQSLSLSNFFQLCPLFQFYMHSLCFPHYRRTPLILWVFIWFLIFSMNCRWLSWKAQHVQHVLSLRL